MVAILLFLSVFYSLWAIYITLFILSSQENGRTVIGDIVLKKMAANSLPVTAYKYDRMRSNPVSLRKSRDMT